MILSIDPNLLTGFYQARLGLSGDGAAAAQRKVAPTAPWSLPATSAQLDEDLERVVHGRRFVDESAAQLDLPGADDDYRRLFAIYNAASLLRDITEEAGKKNLSITERSRLDRAFDRGIEELTDYLANTRMDNLRLAQGEAVAQAKTTAGIARRATEYITPPLVSGSLSKTPAAFEGDVRFSIEVKRSGVVHTIEVDLADLGATPRTMGAVIDHINEKLDAAGLDTRLQSHRLPGAPRTAEVGGKTVVVGPGVDQWALKVKMGIGEAVSFSAPEVAPAIYLAQASGPGPTKANPDAEPQRQELLKFQPDAANLQDPDARPGDTHWVEGRVFAETMGPEVVAVRATQAAPDGSVYVLADVNGAVEGQDIKGAQDVALMKYDSAGALVYVRTLGAAESARGLALAVAADGKVAVAGSVTGALSGAVNGPINSSGTNAALGDSFVTVFDAAGDELWTQRRGARLADEASQLAFGADGTLYVAGRTQSAKVGTSSIGGWDSYIEAFKPDATGKVQSLFTQSFGTNAGDRPAGLVVDGTSVVTASVENGRAILRRFDLSGGTPVLAATRDLGDLQGGELVGLAIENGELVVAGSTRNAALAAGAVSRAHAGGMDAFAARISADLSGGGSIAYYGGAGDDKATSLAVADGKAWIAGSAGGDLPDLAPTGLKDGFLASLDVASGAVDWSRRFTGEDGHAAPTAIAVSSAGASVLDRMGLPQGAIGAQDSQRLVAGTSLRVGDEFTLRVGQGAARTVTIEAKDTLETLAQKVRRATGFQTRVSIVTNGGVRRLQIDPVTDSTVIHVGAGRIDKDALAALGMPEGVIRAEPKKDDDGGSSQTPIYGLSLPSGLSIKNETERKRAFEELTGALSAIRKAYDGLVEAASPESARRKATGTAPAYLLDQIANYQAALTRLTGGR